jgi:monothiol glutaredoxin
MALAPELRQRIEHVIANDRVVLFMKGTKHFPQCGFSATVSQILSKLVPEYATVNVLTDPDIRDGIKAYSEWPTIPQLYVGGKFVGGCDIVREMFQSGELQALLGLAPIDAETAKGESANAAPPKISVSPAAKRAILEAQAGEPGMLRLEVSPEFEHALSIDEPTPGDFQVDAGGITVLIDRPSGARADGVSIDYDTAGSGFKIDNPNESPKVRQLSPEALKSMIDAGERFEFLDVRTPGERDLASIPGTRLLDDAALKHIEALDKDAPLVFHCHHGGRSQAAAERFLRQGFRRVYNLAGGIDAWSATVDPTVTRY